jgi:flagellar protein FlaF
VRNRTAGNTEIELALFRQITLALTEVAEFQRPEPTAWADALSRNMALWSILAADLMNPENTTPSETRDNLIGLSEFVRKTSLRVLAGSEEIHDLIDINHTIIVGLESRPAVSNGGTA